MYGNKIAETSGSVHNTVESYLDTWELNNTADSSQYGRVFKIRQSLHNTAEASQYGSVFINTAESS